MSFRTSIAGSEKKKKIQLKIIYNMILDEQFKFRKI